MYCVDCYQIGNIIYKYLKESGLEFGIYIGSCPKLSSIVLLIKPLLNCESWYVVTNGNISTVLWIKVSFLDSSLGSASA